MFRLFCAMRNRNTKRKNTWKKACYTIPLYGKNAYHTIPLYGKNAYHEIFRQLFYSMVFYAKHFFLRMNCMIGFFVNAVSGLFQQQNGNEF